MKRVLILLMMGLSLLIGATAGAVTLHHNDLVGITAEGIIRIDGHTGERESIAVTTDRHDDIAVAYGGKSIFSVNADSLYEIDPLSGTQRVVATGFNGVGGMGVATNRAGDVFVVTHEDAGSYVRPRLHQVDVSTGNVDLLFESSLPWMEEPRAPWSAIDTEMASESLVAVLGRGTSRGPFGGCCEVNGIVGYDIALETESILVNSGDFGTVPWETIHGLGVLPTGVVAASSDYNYGGQMLGYDPETGLADRVSGAGVGSRLYDDSGLWISVLYGIEFASTPNGRVFVAATGQPGRWVDDAHRNPLPEERGVHVVAPEGGLRLVDGKAFSPGSTVYELQPVVIPEPTTAMLLAVGLAGCSIVRRRAGVL